MRLSKSCSGGGGWQSSGRCGWSLGGGWQSCNRKESFAVDVFSLL